MNPSDFISLPVGSVLRSCQLEVTAKNIMIYLSETGNNWRELAWKEYRDGAMSQGHEGVWREKYYFPQVQPYTVSEEKARSFSPCWKKV